MVNADADTSSNAQDPQMDEVNEVRNICDEDCGATPKKNNNDEEFCIPESPAGIHVLNNNSRTSISIGDSKASDGLSLTSHQLDSRYTEKQTTEQVLKESEPLQTALKVLRQKREKLV